MSNNESQKVQIVTADPSALGLFGLAMITLVASSQKLGLTEGLSFIIPWAIFLGSIAQIIACLYDFKHNNLFGATIFGAYGLFWMAVAFLWMIKMGVFGQTLAGSVDGKQLGVAFIGYLILSVVGTIAALKTSKVLFVTMVFIVLLFIGLAADSFGAHWGHTLAAWTEIIISMLSFYACSAAFLNKWFNKVMLPVGAPFVK